MKKYQSRTFSPWKVLWFYSIFSSSLRRPIITFLFVSWTSPASINSSKRAYTLLKWNTMSSWKVRQIRGKVRLVIPIIICRRWDVKNWNSEFEILFTSQTLLKYSSRSSTNRWTVSIKSSSLSVTSTPKTKKRPAYLRYINLKFRYWKTSVISVIRSSN